MKYLIVTLALVLSACTSIEAETPQQRLYAVQGEFNIALKAAAAYTSQPACTAAVVIGCHKPGVKAGILAGAEEAKGAIDAAKAGVSAVGGGSKVALAGQATKSLINYMISKGILK